MTSSDFDYVARGLLGGAADASVRAVVLASLMGVAIVLLRGTRASARLTAWTAVLCAALALPVLAIAVPAWSWSVPTMALLDAWVPTGSPAIAQQVGSAVLPVVVAPAPGPAWPSAAVMVAAIYLLGVLVFLAHACLAWLAARRLRLSARTIADAVVLARLRRHASAAGLASAPPLLESADLSVPVTTSVRRPIVALPNDWREWPAGKLDAVLIHEIAHVARRDALTQRASLFYRAIFWFSPLSWWLHRRLSDLADQASDEAALEAGIDPATYAGTLVDFFAQLQNGPRRADWHVAMARRADADAAQRVERILSWKGGPIMTRSKLLVTGIVLATVPVVALTASVRVTPDAGPAFTTKRPSIDRAIQAAPVVNPVAPASEPQAPVSAPSASVRPNKMIASELSHAFVGPVVPVQRTEYRSAEDQTRTAPPAQDDDFAKGAYLLPGAPGVTFPKAVTQVKPKYTPDAMRAKLQGAIELEIIVGTDGTVTKARVKPMPDGSSSPVWRVDGVIVDSPPTGPELVEQALIAARQWTFTPSTLNGKPVAVRILLSLEFRLH
jgi:beta-lactamase regulating signal transducer with metallopeptidase domain